MMLKRYGGTFEEVEPVFDARALTEIGFRRTRRRAVSMDEFQLDYERVSAHDLDASAEGTVHDEVETRLLAELEARLAEILSSLRADEVVVIESEPGVDHPKTRSEQRKSVHGGDGRPRVSIRIEPPLRVGVYRRRG